MGPALVVYLQLRHLAMSYALEYTFAFRSTPPNLHATTTFVLGPLPAPARSCGEPYA